MSSGVGNTYIMTGSNGSDGDRHCSDEELFAYLKQQGQGDERWRMMQRHISLCSLCFERINELEQTEKLLKDTFRSSVYDFYPSITDTVMHEIDGPKPAMLQHLSGQESRKVRKRAVLVPVGAMMAAACIFLMVLVLLKPTSRIGSDGKASITPIAQPDVTVSVEPHRTPTPTVAPVTPTPTSGSGTPLSGGLAIGNCTTELDEAEHHLRVCGSGWTPGDKVMLVLVDKHNSIMKRIGAVQVQTDGTFSQNISIHSCKDVPWAIYAEDTSLPGEQFQPLYNIYYGSC